MRIISVFCLLFLGGCANPFAQFYTDMTGGVDITKSDRVILASGPPQSYAGSNVEADTQALMQNGYGMVGYSSFNAANASETQLMQQAKAVNAEIVVYYSQYTNTVSGSIPWTVPTTQTSNTTMQGTAYGTGGYATMSGTATTTTTGSRTTYIPYSSNRYDYMATYWVKLKPLGLGVYFEDLAPETRRKIGSNKGVFVTIVVNDSPAFLADFFSGDIISAVNGQPVVNQQGFSSQLAALSGQEVTFTLLRDGEKLTKTVKLRETR